LFYGVVSAQTEKVVEFFLEREAAEAMIGEVREDEPGLAEELRVEAFESGSPKESVDTEERAI
jgi:sensor histidine kinase regulating citrate/malate metabolism